MKVQIVFFSSLLRDKPGANRLFQTLEHRNILYDFIENTRDIWVRDFMPVKTKSGAYVSFKYEPSYLKNCPELRTNYKQVIRNQVVLPKVTYSDINLDGGNIVFSPSREKVIISDRIYSENPDYSKNILIQKLSYLLEAQVIIVPSLKSDMTGHSDGMIRFINENTVIGNKTSFKNGLEQKIKNKLAKHNIDVIDFPYFSSPGISAVGSYINFLEINECILLPIFDCIIDREAISKAKQVFEKPIVPINIKEIAYNGGGLNCISWEQ